MKKKSTVYSDLSKKQLLYLKELYIDRKVNSMSNEELKEFASEIISHQVNNTIGKEEEIEAWEEMSNFFNEEFEVIVQGIQDKYIQNEHEINSNEDENKLRIELLEKNNLESSKKDMWDD